MKRPNIVYVLTDDQGYGDLGCTGNPWLRTPNIDHFYEESVRMTNYHVGPTCAPTRSGLMTGHYANSTGVWHTIGGRSLLREDEWTIATALRDAGYETGIFGKWHLGDTYPYRPEDRGFSHVVVHGGGGISQTPDFWGNDYFDDTYRVNGEYKPFKGYCTDVFFGEAEKFIHECAQADRPFFCYLATNAPHAPYNVEDRYADLYRGQVMEDRARFYGMITNIDENFGKLRALLREEGIEEDTILIFMTDNGSSNSESYDKDGNVIEGYNAGLRGMKNSEYDGGHRVPFFIRYPAGKVGGGQDCNTLCANVDFMPTMLDFCGVAYPPDAFHGVTVRKQMEDVHAVMPDRCIVTDSQRVPSPIKWRKSAVMKGEMRLINGTELYDVASDRGQTRDIAARHPALVEELRAAYEEWWKLVSVKFEDPIPLYLHKGSCLTAHDWRGDEGNCVWNQGLVRSGRRTCGYWEVKAEQACTYRLKAFRWPPETGYTLCQGIRGSDTGYDQKRTDERYWHYYEGGERIEIEAASVYLDGVCTQKISEISEDMTYVEAIQTIPAGLHTLEVRLKEKNAGEFGAYYLIAEPIVEP